MPITPNRRGPRGVPNRGAPNVANVAVEAEVNLEAEAEADANLKAGNRETPRGDVHKRGFPNSWMVSNAKSEIAWMICSYPHFREPPDKGKFQEFCARYVPLSTYDL